MGKLPHIDYLLIDITSKCNLKCLHCRLNSSREDISFKKIKSILDQAKELDVKTVTFSGGEPFIRKDIFKIIKYSKENSFLTRVQTNSLLLDEQKIRKFKKIELDWIGTGLDGLEENHDKLRNQKGAFKKVVKNLSLFKKYGIKTHIEFTATSFNYLDFDKVVKICNKYNVYDLMARCVIPAGKGKDFKFNLNKKQYKLFLEEVIKQKYKNKKIKICSQDPLFIALDEKLRENLSLKYPSFLKNKAITGCSAGISMLYIGSDSSVKPCSFLNIFFGNLNKQKLKEIINSEKRRGFLYIQLNRYLKGKCSQCKLKFFCGGCRARALNFYSDPFAQDPLCFI